MILVHHPYYYLIFYSAHLSSPASESHPAISSLETDAFDLGNIDDSEDEDNLSDDENNEEAQTSEIAEEDVPVTGVVQTYLVALRDTLTKEIEKHQMPQCYRDGHFWIRPQNAFFALRKAQRSVDGLSPLPLYYPPVFIWLPHLLSDDLHCQEPSCHLRKLTSRGWNNNPVARRVVSLDGLYYVMTQRVQCDKRTGGCGKSWNLYDPIILQQLQPGLAAEFPAFFTHRSGIDKTLMTLIRAGIAHRMSSNAWSQVLRELHIRQHDLQELKYLHAIHTKSTQWQWHSSHAKEPSYIPFSEFKDKNGYAGFSPSRWYINAIYMDFMEHIRPYLDQCVASLTGYVLKWDHSFKLVKLMMKLNGEVTFAALFTLLNEFEQIRYQAFVPTKALSHLRGGLEEMVKSLASHGLAQPILGFTDNVASDAAFFTGCIPSLATQVNPIQLEEFSDLPKITLPDDVTVHLCTTETEIQTACTFIIEQLPKEEIGGSLLIGCDSEWDFETGASAIGPRKTALIQISLPKVVYVMRVYELKKLPSSFEAILNAPRITKVGRNIGGDLAKWERDFGVKLPKKNKAKSREGFLELGKIAKAKDAISTANASLATITAATLQQSLSKEMRVSEWSAPQLSADQIHYAALDAWVIHPIWAVLEKQPIVGMPLKTASPVGQAVSIYSRNVEVAHGKIILQPAKFDIHDHTSAKITSVNVTKSRAVVQVDKILKADYNLSWHKKTIQEVQAGRETFPILVSLSSLKTRNSEPSTPHATAIPAELPRSPDTVTLIHPPDTQSVAIVSEETVDNNSDSDVELEMDDPLDMELPDTGYVQAESANQLPSRILADVFHEIDKVCRTISKKHSLHHKFATAFSDTMLIPDKKDKANVEVYLKSKSKSWDRVRQASPEWLWSRVRRYIPESELLYRILTEFFEAWGHIKCTVTGQPLFGDETWKKVKGVLHDVQKGWISDPSGIPVYTIRKRDKNNLLVYHCIRGTNSVEGAVHNPIRRNFAALNASVPLADSLIADYRHRHNLDIGSVHKFGITYKGHYDPWLDHEIALLRSDITWTTNPTSSTLLPDMEPLDFAPTQEQFGIPCIPVADRIKCDFSGAPVLPGSSDQNSKPQTIYPTQLRLSSLNSKRGNMYEYLATAQETLYAVTPVHTKEEYTLYHNSVAPGGEWAPVNGNPHFDRMAAWWSAKANGLTIFYKLPEHLSSYHKRWLEHRQELQTLVASESQRSAHRTRIRSSHHLATVLNPAPQDQPGVLAQTDITTELLTLNTSDEPDPNNIEMMSIAQDNITGLSQWHTFTSAPLLMHPMAENTPTTRFAKPRASRHCYNCKQAGRSGENCPGRTKRAYCSFCKLNS
jgi:hypothetical protein